MTRPLTELIRKSAPQGRKDAQQWFASLMHVSRRTVVRWAAGAPMKPNDILRAAIVLGVSRSELRRVLGKEK
jgi:hypothetical protein